MNLKGFSPSIILASASPRRRRILSLVFEEFDVVPSSVSEDITSSRSPEQIVEDLAYRKAEQVF